MTLDRDIPKSGSLIRPITMTLPKGTVVNPEFPGACGVRFDPPSGSPMRCWGAWLRPRPTGYRRFGRRHLARGVLAHGTRRPAAGTSRWWSR